MSGDQKATGRLLRFVEPKVKSVVSAILGARHPDLDDAVQVALINFVHALPAYRAECEPAGYARVIASRSATAARRKRSTLRSRHVDGAELDEIGAEPPRDDPADRHERMAAVRELVSELPDEQKDALALRVGLGWSIEEIARETRAPLNTVRSRLRLAKERLRSRIEHDPILREMFDRA